MPALIAIVFLIFDASSAIAHGDEKHDAITWTIDPWIISPLAAVALLYAAGSLRLRTRRKRRKGLFTIQQVWFWIGLAVLALALVSPVHELGEHLFSVHMVEHELVVAVSAPFLSLARPMAVLLWGLPEEMRRMCSVVLARRSVRSIWSALTRPMVATLLHGLAIWAWHYPQLFDAAVTNVIIHRVQHLSFFGTAVLFWWAVFWRAKPGLAAWHQFVTMLHTSMLGALITLMPAVLYRAQTQYAAEWGLTPLEDQQLAGLIMWVPGGIIYAGAALWFLTTWIKASSRGGADDAHIHMA